jgi:hypothetical protein
MIGYLDRQRVAKANHEAFTKLREEPECQQIENFFQKTKKFEKMKKRQKIAILALFDFFCKFL